MKYKYLLILFPLALLGAGCSNGRVEIGNINNRHQLDSIMALLPADSVTIDSLPQRTLRIAIQGNLSLYGVPVRRADFNLAKEELNDMYVESSKDALSLLNKVEGSRGLGKYEPNTFGWDTDSNKVQLRPVYSNRWSLESPEPYFLSDTLGFTYSVTYAGVKNKITELYKEAFKSDNFFTYSLTAFFYSDINYNLYVNGIPVEDPSYDILNSMLPMAGEQTLTIEFLPPFSKLRETNAYIKKHINGGKQAIEISRTSSKTGNQELVSLIIVDIDIDKKGTVQSYRFDLPDLLIKLDYANGQDLRKTDDLKTLIYSHYLSFKDAIESRNTEKVIEMLYPAERTDALAENKSASVMQNQWVYTEMLIDENEGVDLMDINELELEYAADGHLARLVPTKKDKSLMGAQLYILGGSPKDVAYYVFMDKNNKLNFALTR